ncbi:hypothetical protein TruAng_006441 [Truncatella angustata]|nr:hypothetical protein TruAng_006441 [Truncatella angustata]
MGRRRRFFGSASTCRSAFAPAPTDASIVLLFDCGGFQRRFATSFPERAAQYRPLLQVMSAIGAISLKIMGKPSTASEKQLYWESYQHLGLNECQPVNEIGDDQFFTTIFLNIFDDLDRYLDFSNAPSTNNPQSRDQREMQMGDITLGNDLRQDMIWASLRLRLYFAVLNHEPDAVSLNVNNTTDDPFIVKRDDHYWARRMILHLHNVVNYCFGPEKNIAAYQVLVEYSQEWVASKPASFDPILIPADDSSSEFPGIFVLNDAAALGWQLYHLCRILLVAHDPSRPLLGLGGAVDRRSVDNSLKNDTIAICGIANSIGQIDAAHLEDREDSWLADFVNTIAFEKCLGTMNTDANNPVAGRPGS